MTGLGISIIISLIIIPCGILCIRNCLEVTLSIYCIRDSFKNDFEKSKLLSEDHLEQSKKLTEQEESNSEESIQDSQENSENESEMISEN